MEQYRQIQMYVGLSGGGCQDVATVQLDGFSLVSNAELIALEIQIGALTAQLEMLQEIGNKVFSGGLSPSYLTQAALKVSSTQCLNKLKAEIGRAGFVAGYEKCWRESYGTKPNTDSVDEYADAYANRFWQGE